MNKLDGLHLIIPSFGCRPETWGAVQEFLPECESINMFLRRCDLDVDRIRGYESVLCELFGVHKDSAGNLPLGALRHLGITGDRQGKYSLCADPVSLQAGQREVILKDSSSLDIQLHEVETLVQLFNAYYSGQGWCLSADSPMCWHMTIDVDSENHQLITLPTLTFPTINEVANQKINRFLSGSDQLRYWRNILNEIQMLFHDSEVNRVRESQGKPLINSLWLYGPGLLPDRMSPESISKPWKYVQSNDPIVAGLAKLAGSDYQSLSDSFDLMAIAGENASCMVCIDTVQQAVIQNDHRGWETTLQWLDHNWLKPAMHAVARGRLRKLVVHDCVGGRYILTRRGLWRFWRSARTQAFLHGG